MEYITSTDPQEFVTLIQSFTADLEPRIVPGPARLLIAEARGFTHLSPEGMFMIGMNETRIYQKNRVAQMLSKLLSSLNVIRNLTLNDIEHPENSLSFILYDNSDHLMVTQLDQRPRKAKQDDIALVNQALNTIFEGNDD